MATVTLTGAPAGITGVRHNGKRYVLDQPVEGVSDQDAQELEALEGHDFEITGGPPVVEVDVEEDADSDTDAEEGDES